MLISLLLVPLTIDYLTPETYGTWLTISSIVTMLALLDIGIGNGLRNKFSEAVSQGNIPLARSYVSTAYVLFGGLQLLLLLLFFGVSGWLPWQRMFNTTLPADQLLRVGQLTVAAIALKLVLDILIYVLYALQESGKAGLIALVSNALVLLGTFALTRLTDRSLVALAAVSVLSPVVVVGLCSVGLYRTQLRAYRPSFRLVELAHARKLLSLGYQFFIIQLAGIILFYTDNLIIAQLFGPAEVTTYNIAFRYFNVVNTLFAITTAPYWSAFTEAYVKGDRDWMQQSYRQLVRGWMLVALVVVVMISLSDVFYRLWVGDRVTVPLSLSLAVGFFVVINCWSSAMALIINGVGKIRLQLIVAMLSATLNIPLAIFLGRALRMGSAGVILATALSLLLGAVVGGMQARRLVQGRERGIWSR